MLNSKKYKLLEAKVDALYDELNRMARAINNLGVITQAAIRGLDSHTQSIIDLNKNLHIIGEQQNKLVSKIMRSEDKDANHISDSIH